MLFYCLKCRNDTENKNPEITKIKNEEIIIMYSVQYVAVKNQNSSKSLKPLDYLAD